MWLCLFIEASALKTTKRTFVRAEALCILLLLAAGLAAGRALCDIGFGSGQLQDASGSAAGGPAVWEGAELCLFPSSCVKLH